MFLPVTIFYYFHHAFFMHGPSADHCETLPHDREMWALYNASPKKSGTLTKYCGPKTCGQFCTTSDFDREYLRNGARYWKSKDINWVPWKIPVNYGPQTKKYGRILTLPDGLIRNTIFWPLGVPHPQTFTRTRDWPRLARAHPNADGESLPKNCNRENLKFGLKFSVLAHITSG